MDYSSCDLKENEKQAGSSKPKSGRLVHLLLKGLSILFIMLLLPYISSHCFPLLKPIGESMLLKLWDVLRFLVITTVVSFGIMNCQWKAIERANSRMEDNDRYRRAPPLNHAIFNETEQLKSKDDYTNGVSWGSSEIVHPILQNSDENAAVKIHYVASGIANSEISERPTQSCPEVEGQSRARATTGIADVNLGGVRPFGEETASRQKAEVDLSGNDGAAKTSSDNRPAGVKSNDRHLPDEKFSRGLAIRSINEGLTAVTQTNFRSTSQCKEGPILHRRIANRPHLNDDRTRRRSSSVDPPLQRQPSRLSIADASEATNVDSNVKTEDQQHAISIGEIPTPPAVSNLFLSSRQRRSDLNLDQYNHNKRTAKPSRRTTSYSCDFGEDYSPEWFLDYPPTPPFTDPSDSEMEATSPIANSTRSSSVKAVPRSLVEWGQVSSPVDITPVSNSSDVHSPPVALPESAPTSVSPSPGELNRKADAFIARFYEHIRTQRLESFERRRSRTRSVRRGNNY